MKVVLDLVLVLGLLLCSCQCLLERLFLALIDFTPLLDGSADRAVLGLDLVDHFALAATVLQRVMPADTGRFLLRREQVGHLSNHPHLLWAY